MRYIFLLITFLFVSCSSAENTERWPNRNVTYSIDAIHLNGVDLIKANKIIHRAFKAWNDTGVINFTHVMHGQIKVSVKPLKGSVAGYGYYPPYGELHLDSSHRVWTESLLYRVTLHEISHCLGLMHSNDPNSITYFKITKIETINKDDIERLAKFYAKKEKP